MPRAQDRGRDHGSSSKNTSRVVSDWGNSFSQAARRKYSTVIAAQFGLGRSPLARPQLEDPHGSPGARLEPSGIAISNSRRSAGKSALSSALVIRVRAESSG